jgi:hypothetical protein
MYKYFALRSTTTTTVRVPVPGTSTCIAVLQYHRKGLLQVQVRYEFRARVACTALYSSTRSTETVLVHNVLITHTVHDMHASLYNKIYIYKLLICNTFKLMYWHIMPLKLKLEVLSVTLQLISHICTT